jgi:heavy metal sensor kinase
MTRLFRDSLRLRLLAGTSLAILLVLTCLGIAIYLSVKHSLYSQLESELRAKASALAAMTEQNARGIHFDADLAQFPEFSAKSRPEYFELRSKDDKVVYRSASLNKTDLAMPSGDDHSMYQLTLPDGRHGRAVTISFTPNTEHDEEDENQPKPTGHAVALLTVARDNSQVHAALETLYDLLLVLCAAAVVASGTALLIVIRFALRPVDRVSDQIAHFNESELTNRISETDLPAELRPIVERLNGLFQRLASAFERERAFAADVAHELRTPLSAMLTTLDVSRSRPRSPVEYEAALDKLRNLTRRLKDMVQNLLTMARAESKQLTPTQGPVDVAQLVQECWTPFQDRAEAKHVDIEFDLPTSPRTVETDSDKLRIILTNLLDNAVSYSNEGGTISLQVLQEREATVIELANTGNQIPAENMPQVFERFWRKDSSRSETGVHCGLGLSLCERLAGIMEIKLEAFARSPDWFVVRVSLPNTVQNLGKNSTTPAQ